MSALAWVQHTQVASGRSAAVESSSSESRVAAGVRGLKFAVVPCPLLLSDQVRCGVPVVQHTVWHTYSPGRCPRMIQHE